MATVPLDFALWLYRQGAEAPKSHEMTGDPYQYPWRTRQDLWYRHLRAEGEHRRKSRKP